MTSAALVARPPVVGKFSVNTRQSEDTSAGFRRPSLKVKMTTLDFTRTSVTAREHQEASEYPAVPNAPK